MPGLVLKGFNGFYNTVDIVWRNLSGNKILSQKLHKKQFAQVMDHALMFLIWKESVGYQQPLSN